MARTVPWTRKLEERRTLKDGREVDLPAFLRDHREELVLKPAHAYGGRDVLVGDETPAAAWEAALRAGMGRAWVAQERVPIPEESFPTCEGGALRFEDFRSTPTRSTWRAEDARRGGAGLAPVGHQRHRRGRQRATFVVG